MAEPWKGKSPVPRADIEKQKEYIAFTEWYRRQYGAGAVSVSYANFRDTPQYSLWVDLGQPAYPVSQPNIQKAWEESLRPSPPEWKTQPWLGQPTTEWDYPITNPEFAAWYTKQTPRMLQFGTSGFTGVSPTGEGLGVGAGQPVGGGVDDTALALLQGGGGATQTPSYGSQLPPGGMPLGPSPAGGGQMGGQPSGAGDQAGFQYFKTMQDIPRQYLEDPLRWQIRFEPDTQLSPGGYYVLPSSEWVSEAQQRQNQADLWGRQDAQAIAAYNAQAQQWQAQAFQNERQAEIEREKMQQEAAQVKAQQDIEKQKYLAQLAANPQSWLEYNAAAGTKPTIQPWMVPLMSYGYDIPTAYGSDPGSGTPVQKSEIRAGQPIPGYSPRSYSEGENVFWTTPGMSQPGYQNPYRQTGAGGVPDYSKLPQLQTPDRAYWEGLGPTSQSQYLGYEQARTGAPGLETLWRLPWEQTKRALPSGGGMSLSYRR